MEKSSVHSIKLGVISNVFLCRKYSNNNWYLVSKIVLTYCEKIYSSDGEKLLKIRGRESAKWDHWNNLLEQWKVRTRFETEYFFNLLLYVSLSIHNWNKSNVNWNKEQVRKDCFSYVDRSVIEFLINSKEKYKTKQ